MKADRIDVDEFIFESILDCRGRKAFGEHGYLIVKGVIKQSNENKYLEKAKNIERVHVFVSDSEEKIIFFCGILYEFHIYHENGVPIMTIHLKTGSYLADIDRHRRSFQRDGVQYESIAKICLNQYERGGCILGKILPTQTNCFLMQYDETDWEFINRLASLSNSMILPDDISGYVRLCLGIPQFTDKHRINSDSYNITKNFTSQYSKSGELHLTERDFFLYEVEEREVYRVGDSVEFLDRSLIIYAIDIKMKGSELVHTYYLTTEAAISVNRIWNEKLSGNSACARVTGVKKDKVTVEIEGDENNSVENKRWFQYATIYSSPDGTGWYCMPEVGDEVRIYFPTDHENDAYIESSVHLDSAENRQNPQEKSIMNRQKKEILFTPNSLILRNNDGLSIELLDEEGIKIISNKSVFISAQDTIQLKSNLGEIAMNAEKNIEMKQGNAQFKIAEKITMTGGKINLN